MRGVFNKHCLLTFFIFTKSLVNSSFNRTFGYLCGKTMPVTCVFTFKLFFKKSIKTLLNSNSLVSDNLINNSNSLAIQKTSTVSA